MVLSNKDAIYITSWGAYNEGRAAGGWFDLFELMNMIPEERIAAYQEKGLDPYGRDEELVVHDYDDYSEVGYYEIFGETHPSQVIDFYEELYILDEEEMLIFIGLRKAYSQETAMEALENHTLDQWSIYNEYLMEELAEEQIEQELATGNLGMIENYIDREYLQRDLEMDVSYDDDGTPEYIVDDEYIDMFLTDIINNGNGFEQLRPYIDMEGYTRYITSDYTVFEHDGQTYYIAG